MSDSAPRSDLQRAAWIVGGSIFASVVVFGIGAILFLLFWIFG